MLDAGDLVLRFALGKLRGLDAAVEDRAVVCELGNVCELLGVLRMSLRGGRRWRCRSLRSTRSADGLESAWPCRLVKICLLGRQQKTYEQLLSRIDLC